MGMCFASLVFGAGCGTMDPGAPMEIPGPEGAQGPQGEPGAQGKPGDTGPAGADGQLRIYGDGSAGDLIVASNTIATLGFDTATDFNYQFTSITVQKNGLLFMPSGCVLRCTGAVAVDGLIALSGPDSSGGSSHGYGGASIGGSIAGPGDRGDATANRSGGLPGHGIDQLTAANIVNPGIIGGGGGAGGNAIAGADGGGSLLVLAKGAITVSATGRISADGQSNYQAGSGGGGGGVIIMASLTGVTNDGILDANGGEGGDSSSDSGPGGGGGGGIVHLIAPSVTPGTIHVEGGAAGDIGAAGSVTINVHSGGGGGGACGGDGGYGGTVDTNKNPNNGSAGKAGWVFTTEADPTALF